MNGVIADDTFVPARLIMMNTNEPALNVRFLTTMSVFNGTPDVVGVTVTLPMRVMDIAVDELFGRAAANMAMVMASRVAGMTDPNNDN